MRSGRRYIAWLLLVVAGAIGPVAAGTRALSTTTGLVIEGAAGRLDTLINSFTKKKGIVVSEHTKVVPIIVGKRYVGAAQVVGSVADLAKVESVALSVARIRGRNAKVLVPNYGKSRVAISAVIDVAPAKGRDVVKVGARESLNTAINSVSGVSRVTRVVTTVGAYAGDMQVMGPASSVDKVKAVFAYEESFDGGKYHARVLVPSSSSLRPNRVQGVGISAMVDASRHFQHAL